MGQHCSRRTSQKPSSSLSTACAGASSRVLLDLVLTEAAAAGDGLAGQQVLPTGVGARWHVGALTEGPAEESGHIGAVLLRLLGKSESG